MAFRRIKEALASLRQEDPYQPPRKQVEMFVLTDHEEVVRPEPSRTVDLLVLVLIVAPVATFFGVLFKQAFGAGQLAASIISAICVVSVVENLKSHLYSTVPVYKLNPFFEFLPRLSLRRIRATFAALARHDETNK